MAGFLRPYDAHALTPGESHSKLTQQLVWSSPNRVAFGCPKQGTSWQDLRAFTHSRSSATRNLDVSHDSQSVVSGKVVDKLFGLESRQARLAQLAERKALNLVVV
eukprot:3504339-Rhodomonas_salina.1